jgi:putative tryptophan/tyrosine transport system substrate-binding protein
MNTRRKLIVALGAGALGAPLACLAQPAKKIPKIGYLGIADEPDFDRLFRRGLSDHGYVEGQNIHIEYRNARGKFERLPALAAELVDLKVDVIVASSTQAIDAAKRATKTIPIVFPVTFDPVASGFIASLARPGGNITGLSSMNPEVMGKRVELLKEMLPRISRIAVLLDSTNSGSKFALKETDSAARALSIRLQVLDVRNADDLDFAIRAASKERAGAMIVMPSNLFGSQQSLIVDLLTRYRLPATYSRREYVEAGGLMSYGSDISDLYRRAASYVDRILKGAKPAEMPVEQPTKFELVVNMKTSKALGIKIPNSILVQATKVIE